MVALESFVVALHAMWGLDGSHQKQVVAIRHILRRQYAHETLPPGVCINIYWAIFLDGHAFVAQDGGEAITSLNGLVANLHCNAMTTLINVSYNDLTGQTQPQAKKRKTLDLGLNLGERGGRGGEPNTSYGGVGNRYPSLNAN